MKHIVNPWRRIELIAMGANDLGHRVLCVSYVESTAWSVRTNILQVQPYLITNLKGRGLSTSSIRRVFLNLLRCSHRRLCPLARGLKLSYELLSLLNRRPVSARRGRFELKL